MKRLARLALLSLSTMTCQTKGVKDLTVKQFVETCRVGHRLFLNRSTFPTFRACVLMDGDCQFIAGIMQKAEPRVLWYCE
jgi:hypothetical protein